MLPIYVLTSDRYHPMLRIFTHLFNKYWSPDQPVGVAGFAEPEFDLPDNFTFMSLGDQRDYPVTKWSDGMLKLLDLIPHEQFVLFFEDYLLVESVNLEIVYRLYDYMDQFPRIVKIDLAGDRAGADPVRELGTWRGIDLLLSDPVSQYHMSLYIGLWRKVLLRELLIPGETPWQVELDGTNRLREYGDAMMVVGTRNLPVHITLGNRYGDPTVNYLDELCAEDMRELAERGLIP